MAEQSDHDLLIKLNTLVEKMAEQQEKFIESSAVQHSRLQERVAILEQKDSRDSEKFKGLAEEIRRSLNNASKIETLQTDLNNMGVKLSNSYIIIEEQSKKLEELRKKSNLYDAINAAGVTLSGIVGYIFGQR